MSFIPAIIIALAIIGFLWFCFWLLFLFIRMSKDINALKERLVVSDFRLNIEKAKEEYYIGNVDLAREYLNRAKFYAENNNQTEQADHYLAIWV